MEANPHDRRPSERHKGYTICLGASCADQGYCVYQIDEIWEDRAFLPRIVTTEAFSDFTIACGGQERKVHRIILNAGSDYFQAMFRVPCQETISGRLELPDDDAHLVWWMVDYIYHGHVRIHAAPPPPDGNVLEACVAMYAMGDKFQVTGLPDCAEEAIRHLLAKRHWRLHDVLDMIDAIDELTADRDGLRARVWFWLGHHSNVVKRYAAEVMMHWDSGEPKFSSRVHLRELYMTTLGSGMRPRKRQKFG